MLTGTGTAGAYHAGVLRALHEAGVKIDIAAGIGVGAAAAAFTAIDGGARLWEPDGLWRARKDVALYGWHRCWRAASWAAAAALVALVVPLAVLATALLVYPLAFLIGLTGTTAGPALVAAYDRLIGAAFEPAALPTLVPRLVLVTLVGLLLTLGAGALQTKRRSRRREEGRIWWRAVAPPLDARPAIARFTVGVSRLVRGAAAAQVRESPVELSRAFSELLSENLGQPGFRELLLTAYDVDARRDLVFAMLAEPLRRRFFGRRTGAEADRRQGELVDLSHAGRDHALDAIAGALSLPLATEAHVMTFAADSYWRGETHRLVHRPDALGRLLDEAGNAGVEQVILVSATEDPTGPHTLSAVRRDWRRFAGEQLAAMDAAAVRDAAATRGRRFKGFFLIRPIHNPLGPFDFTGGYDERSDRVHRTHELIESGYEDAYRQFIDPVVGASGEKLETPEGMLGQN